MKVKIINKFLVRQGMILKGLCTVYVDENKDTWYEIFIDNNHWIIIYTEDEFKNSDWKIL